tara:strand:+ start:4382 stop:4978 length:597 start_codon:yes stop_codon:yes gene_type:complete
VGGFNPLTSIDYPGELAAVVFCQGCPWRCRYCHNAELLPAKSCGELQWSALLNQLEDRRGLLDAIVFSGGEPTAQRALFSAIEQVRQLGFKVGLHTAGAYPERLRELLPLLDWVGLDIKALPTSYDLITGVTGSGGLAWESAHILANSPLAYQVRLTQHPLLTSDAEIEQIKNMLSMLGVDELKVQQCRTDNCLDASL